MELVVLGATGRIGAEAVEEVLRRGWTVRAVTRSAVRLPVRPRLSIVRVDFEDPDRVGAAVGDADGVIACLRPHPAGATELAEFSAATRRLVAALERQRIRRLVILSDAGVRLPRERPVGLVGRIRRMLRRAGRTLAAQQVEFEIVAASRLEWTALRPQGMRDGARTGRYELSELDPGVRAGISRSDVALALVDQVSDSHYVHQAPFVWTPRERR